MSTMVSVRLSKETIIQLEEIGEITERSKSFHIKKAIEQYIKDYADYQIALDRLNDVNDEIISSKEMRKRLASKN